jgi:hypothetical protein
MQEKGDFGGSRSLQNAYLPAFLVSSGFFLWERLKKSKVSLLGLNGESS